MTGRCHADAVHGSPAAGAVTRLIVGAAYGLQLAAAPTFAVMAMLTAIAGNGAVDILCAVAQDASPLTGMTLMYLLMSVVHATP